MSAGPTRSASSWRVSCSSCGIILVCPMIVMKLASPTQRGTTCMCRWSASDPPDTLPRFRPTLNPIGCDTALITRIAFCVNAISSALSASSRSSSSDTRRYGTTIRWPGVVRVEIQHDVDRLAAGHDEAFLVGKRRDLAERPVRGGVVALEGRLGDVGHPVRRPQPLQPVGHTDTTVDDGVVASGSGLRFAHGFTRSAVGEAFSRWATQSTIASIASARGTLLS